MKTKICPRCGSENIEWIIPQNWSMWSCNDCDYTGPIIEADDVTEKEIQEEWKYHKDDVLKRMQNKDFNEEDEETGNDKDFEEKLDKLVEDEEKND